VNRRYIALIAVVAFLTLAVGLIVRRELRPHAPAAPVAPPSQATALQQLSEEAQARRLSSFLSERASDVSPLIEYVEAAKASGLRWRGGDTLVTTFPDQPVVALPVARGDTTRTPSLAPSDSLRGAWALVVARRPGGGFVSTAGILGGTITTRCADRDVREYVLGVGVPDAFAGAGLFDLSGRVVGFVARCGGRLVALPVGEVTRLMAARDSLGALLWERLGVEARPLDAAARSYFGADSGLLVTAVRHDAPADRAGLFPGDIVAQVNGVPVDTVLPSSVLGSLATADSQVLVIRRPAARRTTRLSISTSAPGPAVAQTNFGIEFGRAAPAGVEIGRVQPGSLANRAGLRPGDRVLRIGRVPVNSTVSVQRALARLDATDSAAFVVFRRDSVSRGVLLR
jgi:S1-C subfamily serine protease